MINKLGLISFTGIKSRSRTCSTPSCKLGIQCDTVEIKSQPAFLGKKNLSGSAARKLLDEAKKFAKFGKYREAQSLCEEAYTSAPGNSFVGHTANRINMGIHLARKQNRQAYIYGQNALNTARTSSVSPKDKLDFLVEVGDSLGNKGGRGSLKPAARAYEAALGEIRKKPKDFQDKGQIRDVLYKLGTTAIDADDNATLSKVTTALDALGNAKTPGDVSRIIKKNFGEYELEDFAKRYVDRTKKNSR